MPTDEISMEEAIKEWLQGRVKPGRYEHILGVLGYITMLAETHHLPVQPLRYAALLHDSARDVPPEELLSMAQGWGLPIRQDERETPMLLHGKIGIELARREWGLTDRVMVSAIEHHTLGHPAMSESDMAFYLADGLEPTRDYPRVDEFRAMAKEDIERATLALAADSVTYNRKRGRTPHTFTRALVDHLRERLGDAEGGETP